MPTFDRSTAISFGFNPLDRVSEKRPDEAFVDARRNHPSTRFLVFVGETPVLRSQENGFDPLFSHEQAAELGTPILDIFLGEDQDGTALFALALDEELQESLAARPGLELAGLRSLAQRGLTTQRVLGELGGAKSVLNWHQRHRFCANCGAPSKVSCGGWRRDCAACGATHFPRVDPVVIMLAIDGDRCLLGRQAHFAPGMYSALAGFLEPGETIEDAVRREIHEEAGVHCSQVSYFASQPWPFPSSLMIGCFAKAVSTDVLVDENELEDARWFTRAEVAMMFSGTHPDAISAPLPFAIAHHLLKAFLEEKFM